MNQPVNSTPARIGVVSGVFHPESGGFSTNLYHLLPALKAQGHAVRLLTYGEPYDHDYGYPVIRISRRGGRLARTWAFLRALWALARWADRLFVMGYVLPLPLLRPFTRKPIITKIVADYSWEYADRNGLTTLDVVAWQTARLPLRLDLMRRYYRLAVRCSSLIYTPSEHVARLVRGWGVPADRVQVIYNAIPDSGLYGVDRAVLRAELRLPHGVPVLVSIARLTPVKGVDVALDALPHLPPDCHFVVVGDGPQEAELRAQAAALGVADRVHFVGRQLHDDALRYLRAGDVFVLSSRTEGLSHVLLEAINTGTPAVASRVGGNPEIITDGVDGLLVPPDDPPALASAIRRLLDDPAFAERIAQAGYARSAAFSWQTTQCQSVALIGGGQGTAEQVPT